MNTGNKSKLEEIDGVWYLHIPGPTNNHGEHYDSTNVWVEDKVAKAFLEILKERVEKAQTRADLYGRLHETIEMFKSGNISAEVYSNRHAVLTQKLSELQSDQKLSQERGKE